MQPGRPATGQTLSAPTAPSFPRRAVGAPAHTQTSHDARTPSAIESTPPEASAAELLGQSAPARADACEAGIDAREARPDACESWADALRRSVGERNYDHWFAQRATVDCRGTDLTIGVASAFIVSWMQKTFHATVLNLARQRVGSAARVRFVVDARAASASGVDCPPASTPNTSTPPASTPIASTPIASLRTASTTSASSPNPLNSVRLQPANPNEAAPGSSLGTILRTKHAIARRPIKTNANPGHANSKIQNTGHANPADRGEATAARRPSFTASAGSHPAPGSHPAAGSQFTAGSPVASPAESPAPTTAKLSRRLAELADFVSGPGGELALVAAQQVSESPGARYNPLYLHGGVGLGKTHLLEGIHRQIRRNVPHLQVMLLSAEAFANQFTDALRLRTLPAFRSRFRTVDVLLIDDVDFFDGKQVIQEEFLHTFKQLEALGRQVVATSDRHPRLLMKTSDELVSRLQSGLVCRIECPDLETRRRIATAKAARLEADIAPEALALVAQRFTNNVRELEGALQSLATWHHLTKRRVTASVARQALANLERDCVRVVRVGDIEQTVCRFFGVSADDLRSSRRNRTLSQPRMLAMFLARKLTQAAYGEIGQHFGGRNHSTVMSAERKVQEWLADGATIKIAAQSYPLSELLQTLEQEAKAS